MGERIVSSEHSWTKSWSSPSNGLRWAEHDKRERIPQSEGERKERERRKMIIY